MAHRTASLSPERPAALRSFRRTSTKSLPSSCLGKSILTPRHRHGKRQVTPLLILAQVGRISQFATEEITFSVKVEQQHSLVVEEPKVLIGQIKLSVGKIDDLVVLAGLGIAGGPPRE